MSYFERAKKFRAKKRLGQNFLTDEKAIETILDTSDITKDDVVVEIGPGLGFVTEHLVKLAKKVYAVELDEDMVKEISKIDADNIEILHKDILKTDLSAFGTNLKVVANIPYYITSPILAHLLGEVDDLNNKNRNAISQVVLMVQYEVAKRLTANEKSPSIIFIDEMDAIALDRSFQSLRGDVSEIVNSLLTEMDGINENESVITIGATNNPTSLDYAVRSRFEEEIEFKLPNDNERLTILENNLKTMPVDYDLNLGKIVKLTKGLSGRDLKEKILKTALHNAIANDEDIITMKHIDYALKSTKVKNNEVKGMFE